MNNKKTNLKSLSLSLEGKKRIKAESMNIFNDKQQEKAEYILHSDFSKLSKLSSQDVRNLCCAWCYYSGKIEGNTYTYVETASLLIDNITSEKRYEDAKMLKNLYNAFNSEMEYIKQQGNKEEVSERSMLRLHKIISSELISSEASGTYRNRAVRIVGTDYIPPKDTYEIQSKIGEIFFEQEKINNPLEKAIFLHCKIAKTQPFIDGNKRTSRLMESIAMINANLIPVFSTKDSDITQYRRAIVNFYEKGDYSSYTDYFLDKQIERIEELCPTSERLISSYRGWER